MRSTVPHNNFALQGLAKAWLVLLLIVGLVSQLKAQNDSKRGERNSVFVDAPLLQSPADGAKNISINPTFTWSSARGAETYQIEVSTRSDFKGKIDASASGLPSSPTLWSASGLSPNTLYYWHVGADSGRVTVWSVTFSFTTASLPSVPALSSPSNGATGVSTSPTLSWHRSTNADSYVVKYFTGSSVVENIVSDTSFTATGLTKSTTYTWQVRASGPGGSSAFSGEWTFTTGGGAPGAPTLTAPPNGATGVSINPTLSWNPVTGATSYSVDVSKNSSFSQIVASSASQIDTIFSVSGLAYNTQYFWRVKATNTDGSSGYTTASFSTQTAKPNPPTIISPNGSTNVPTSGRLEWGAVTGATSYEVEVDTDNKFGKPVISTSTTSAFHPYSGFLNSQVYFWRVRVITSGGTSDWSSVASFTTTALKIAVPAPFSPTNGTTSVPVNATLTWNYSVSNASFDIEVADTISFSRIASSGGGIRTYTFNTSALTTNKKYYWRVRAIVSEDTSDWSTIFNFTTETGKLPAPELILPANNAQNQSTELSLNWKLVPGALSYGVEIATDQNFKKDVTAFTGISTASYSLQGLSPKTTYYWHVYAANAHGPGAWSEAWNFTTAPPTLTTPTLKAPVDRAKDVSTVPNLEWNGVANATSYMVQVSTTSRFEPGTITVDQSGVLGTIFPSPTLLNNATYYWRVKAMSSTGSSDWSSAWEFTTIASQLFPPSPLKPDEGAVTSTAPELVWTNVNGATSYSIQYSTDRNFRNDVIEISGISSALYTLHGLLPTTTYYWHVRAKDSLNTSGWSNSRSFTTGSGLVAPPKLLDPMDNATGVSLNAVLSWSISPGAKTYGVQVSEDKGFKNIVFDTSGVQKTSLVVRNLGQQKTYYWHVNAADSTGSGSYSDYWSFKTGSGQLSAPLLSSPLDGAQAVSVRPLLTWSPVIGAKTYTLQISDDRRLSKNVFEEDSIRTTSFGASFELSPNTTYYWQVRASDSLNASDWSGIWEFTTGSGRLSAPTLLYPPDKTNNVPVNFTLSWSNIAGAVSYGVQIATDSKFQEIVFQDSVKTTSLDITGFSRDTKYYWHVNAVDSSGKKSDWSQDWMLTTGTSLLAAPQLVFPSNGTIGTSINPKMEWTIVKGALSYNLQYTTDRNFRKDLVEVDGIAGASYQINIPFLVNTTYYWRVQSKANSITLSAWSDYWSFITGNGILATPVLRSPSDGAEVSTTPTLQWDESLGAKLYALQVSEQSNFSRLIVDEGNIDATIKIYPLAGLETKKTYYWRVRAIKDNETSDWTPTWKFKTSVTTGVEITESSVPSSFTLSQNFPNPFNPSTTIEFSIPKSSDVKIMIYNILGNLVHTLVDQHLSPGTYRTQWNAIGKASGVYFYRIQANGFVETKRLVFIK